MINHTAPKRKACNDVIDYGKAFDFIDHGILVNKIKVGNLNIPPSIDSWIIHFFLKENRELNSQKVAIPSGAKLHLEYRKVPNYDHGYLF